MIIIVLYGIVGAWITGTLILFIVLVHEGLVGKDPKGFVQSWTDILGMVVYLLASCLIVGILMGTMLVYPKQTWHEVCDVVNELKGE